MSLSPTNTIKQNAARLRDSIIEEYRQAGIAKHNSSAKIIRCINRNIPDLIEELISDYIANEFIKHRSDRIYMNPAIRLNEKMRRFDSIWCKEPDKNNNCIVRAVFEIKTDMGYYRKDSTAKLQKFASEVTSLKGSSIQGTTQNRQNVNFHFPKKLPFFLLIVAEENSGPDWRKMRDGLVKNSGVVVLKLLRETHPNLKNGKHINSEVEVNTAAFKILHEKLKLIS